MRDLVRRVGQRFVVGFQGLTASPDVKHLIRDLGVQHVILFGRNVESPEQVAELVRELRSVGRAAGLERPLAVAVDQEGGPVSRFQEPWTVWPPLRALGRLDSEDLARRMGEALAAELTACGVSIDFAPVVDVDSNPKNPVIGERSFGSDPNCVGRLGLALARGLESGGVAAFAKHFPGHGDTEVDSHHDLPVIAHDRARLDEVELSPFRTCIEGQVSGVLVAHVLAPELDEDWPASLSVKTVDTLLRDEMGFDGVVATDDLEMKAVAGRWPPDRLAVQAAQAGCDLLLFCHDADTQVRAIEGLIHAVEGDEIPFSEAEASEKRLNRLQERFLEGSADPDPRRAREVAGRGEHRELAEEIATGSGIPA